jgi:hypothetical protein
VKQLVRSHAMNCPPFLTPSSPLILGTSWSILKTRLRAKCEERLRREGLTGLGTPGSVRSPGLQSGWHQHR